MAPPLGKKQIRVNALTAANMISEMMDGPTSAATLSEVSGMHTVSVWRWLRALKRAGVIYIAGWEKDAQGGYRIALYQVGRGKDKPKPRMTNAERCQRWRAKATRAQVANALTSGVEREPVSAVD